MEHESENSYRSLPVLQSSLDGLSPAQFLLLDHPHIERLFGWNDVAANRLKRFARSQSASLFTPMQA